MYRWLGIQLIEASIPGGPMLFKKRVYDYGPNGTATYIVAWKLLIMVHRPTAKAFNYYTGQS